MHRKELEKSWNRLTLELGSLVIYHYKGDIDGEVVRDPIFP